MQQSYARVSGVVETISVQELVEDSLRFNAESLQRHKVEVVRDFTPTPPLAIEKNKVVQILVNLIRNAKFACDERPAVDVPGRIIVSTRTEAARVSIAIVDNGVGIAPENLIRIFSHGFTTRKTGHGFGLHSGALAAKELGGTLTVHSKGRGHGASFVLELPLKPIERHAN